MPVASIRLGPVGEYLAEAGPAPPRDIFHPREEKCTCLWMLGCPLQKSPTLQVCPTPCRGLSQVTACYNTTNMKIMACY